MSYDQPGVPGLSSSSSYTKSSTATNSYGTTGMSAGGMATNYAYGAMGYPYMGYG